MDKIQDGISPARIHELPDETYGRCRATYNSRKINTYTPCHQTISVLHSYLDLYYLLRRRCVALVLHSVSICYHRSVIHCTRQSGVKLVLPGVASPNVAMCNRIRTELISEVIQSVLMWYGIEQETPHYINLLILINAF